MRIYAVSLTTRSAAKSKKMFVNRLLKGTTIALASYEVVPKVPF